MEPFNEDELSDQELNALLHEWKAPRPPAHLRAAVFPSVSQPWWRRLWGLSIRVPAPVAAMVALVAVLAAWLGLTREPPVIVRTERVEVPVYQDRASPAPVYREEGARQKGSDLQPVAELRPIIIRSEE